MIHFLLHTPDGVMLFVLMCVTIGFFIGRYHDLHRRRRLNRVAPRRELDGFDPANKENRQ